MYFIIIIILSHGKMKVLAIMVYYPRRLKQGPPDSRRIKQRKELSSSNSNVSCSIVPCCKKKRYLSLYSPRFQVE